ncbi:MAG: SGNH/GDSL hydrolase family protein, partial [Verrucomicrobiota bacterium]
YNTVQKLEVGVPEDATFEPVAPRKESPIVFYGTSITHGASASRPGMTHPAILGRRLNCPIINLGFSGNGRLEIEIAAMLAELDAAVYVIDCLPNLSEPEVIAERTEPFVKLLRNIRPDTPIILVEDRTYTNAWVFGSKRTRHRDCRAALLRAYDNLVAAGIRDLHYQPGHLLLGTDTEATMDSSHPSDLGFWRQANELEKTISAILGE